MVSREEVASVFPVMVERFDPTKAEGVNGTIQFSLSGESGGDYWLRIADGKAETGTGLIENPRMTLRSSADDFYSMLEGKLNPMQAFMTGKIKVQGDTTMAMKLMPLIQ